MDQGQWITEFGQILSGIENEIEGSLLFLTYRCDPSLTEQTKSNVIFIHGYSVPILRMNSVRFQQGKGYQVLANGH